MKTLFFILVLSAGVFAAHAIDRSTIALKNMQTSYAPKSFYISDVVDDRGSNAAIGSISGAGKKEDLNLQNGTAASLKNFINHNVAADKATQAIVLHIDKMDINVHASGETRQVEAAITFSFYAAGKKVLETSGKGQGQMDEDAGDYIEGFIRKTIESDLQRFDGWWQQNGRSIATQSSVKVNVTIGRTTDKPNCIVYSLQRPLSISDFIGPVEGEGNEMAATMSGINMTNNNMQVQNGQLVLDITITPVFSKTESWFKEEGKNAHVLAHEQAHLDITAIKACELASAIRKASFTEENYVKLLEDLQKQNFKDTREEEDTYDNETNHGIIEDKQIEWQSRLTKQVREIGCY